MEQYRPTQSVKLIDAIGGYEPIHYIIYTNEKVHEIIENMLFWTNKIEYMF